MRKTPIWPLTNRVELSQCIALQLNGAATSPLITLQAMLNQTVETYGLSGWRMISEYPEMQEFMTQTQSPIVVQPLRQPLCSHQQLIGLLEWHSDNAATLLRAEAHLSIVTDCCAVLLSSSLQYAESMLDPTTHLLDRRFLAAYVEQRQAAGNSVVVASIDVNGLKHVNDTRGHAVGDEMLQAVAYALSCCCRLKDFAIRLGGDEFALILRDIPEQKIKHVQRCLKKRLQTVLTEIAPISFAFGITVGPAQDLRTLLKTADEQMYRHKRQSKRAREVHYA